MTAEQKTDEMNKIAKKHSLFHKSVSAFLRWPSLWLLKQVDLKEKIKQLNNLEEIFNSEIIDLKSFLYIDSFLTN